MKIEVKNVSKQFKKVSILNNINLTFESGKIYGLIGRNGSGKSVFLKMLCAFYAPTEGEILFDGVNVIKMRQFPPNTRSLIEKPNFIPNISGFENLYLLSKIQHLIDSEKIVKTLEEVYLKEDMNKKYSEYSLGMKQKLGIAQVLMEEPDVMILDEPFNGIEKKTVKEIRARLLEEKKRGKLIIIASHIEEDIDQLADEVYEVDGGLIERIKKNKNKNEQLENL